MNEEKKTEVKVGITVLAAIIVFIFIYGWAKNIDLSSNDTNIIIKFETVAGLELGDLVSVNGVRKGLVNSITTKENYALVEVKFNEAVNLKQDATFSVMMLDLMGGKKIEINPGNSVNFINYDEIQIGKFAGDISTAMATLSSVETDLIEVIGELKTSLHNANKLFNNDKLTDNIISSMEQIKLLSTNFNQLIIQNRTVFNETIRNVSKLSESTNNLLNNNSEKVGSILIKFDSTLTASNILLQNLNNFSNEIANSENNIGKIMYDEDLLNDLQNSLKQIKELTKTINEQLKSGGLEVKADVDLF
jgi:phospholipid/cholesterol/gamma-HCH transport system substrate-binding protein